MKKITTHSAERGLLLKLIEQSYNKEAWHGPNLKGATRRVGPAEAVWRPRPGSRNIAEIVVHCAYWKYAIRRRIRGDKRGSFALKGSNWFALPAKLTNNQWRELVALLDSEHGALLEAVASAPWARLVAKSGGRGEPAAHVYGVAMHDTYHAGQVRTLKALYKRATAKKPARKH